MSTPATKTVQRRRPRQTRSRTTAAAIQQAFLQLLVEQGYDAVSVRQVVELAGVGIGSFYEYFSSKDSLAAICVHLSIKGVLGRMSAALEGTRSEFLPQRVEALVRAQAEIPLSKPEQWSALFALERRVSSAEAYQSMYEAFADAWEQCLVAAPDWPQRVNVHQAALTVHGIVYGLVSQALLNRDEGRRQSLLPQLILSAHGYLSVIAPHAYRAVSMDRLAREIDGSTSTSFRSA